MRITTICITILLIYGAKSSLGTANVYAVTFHELAHASHHNKAGNSYWVKYINYIVTYGAYGNGTGNSAGVCERVEYGRTTPFSGNWFWFDKHEDWYNPGFLKDVDNISDVTTAEIFSCLTSSTDTFSDLRNQ